MSLRTVPTQPFPLHRQLSQALQQPLAVFQGEHYLANLVQCYLNLLTPTADSLLILGGDGQGLTQAFLQTILKVAVGNHLSQILMGCDGLLTPALMSHLILEKAAIGGIFLHSSTTQPLTFTLQFYWRDGTVLNQSLLAALQERTQIIRQYAIDDLPHFPLHRPQTQTIGRTQITLFQAPHYYLTLLDACFDLESIPDFFQSSRQYGTAPKEISLQCLDFHTLAIAKFLLEDCLGFLPGTVTLHLSPRVSTCVPPKQYFFQGLVGSEHYALEGINASDSLAILTANVAFSPYYRSQFQGVTRSQLISAAVDHVCADLHWACHEGSSHWEILSQGLAKPDITWVANETGAFGHGQSRSPDGLWAIIFWLTLIAQHRASPLALLQHHWQKYGRHYWASQSYPSIAVGDFDQMLEPLLQEDQRGKQWGEFEVAFSQALPGLTHANHLARQLSRSQTPSGIMIGFTDGSRLGIVQEKTTTEDRNLKIMRERYVCDPSHYYWPLETALAPLGNLAEQLLAIA